MAAKRKPFRNEPVTDFSRPEARKAMERSFAAVEGKLGREYPLVIGGKKIATARRIASINPSEPTQVVGFTASAEPEHVKEALEAAGDAFERWSRVEPQKRAGVLSRAASLMRKRRLELAAWMVLEAGKNWSEADADVCEAIDFLEYYGREMLRISQGGRLSHIPAEDNRMDYIPLGVGVVIPPWNFPLAILAGMTSAALVTGNAVILKPASNTPVVAAHFVEILEEAGLPPGALNFLPGSGSVVGDPLVEDPRTRFVAFTGSKEVGLRINELAAKHQPGQRWVKRVIVEMGGKDAIVVDASADLEEAVRGAATSAFGYQGQKCSACSRLILVDELYDEAIERLRAETERIRIGPVRDPENFLGPVIDETALEKILSYIEIGKQEGRLVTGGRRLPREGYFLEPAIFADVAPKSRLAREEIFGPVLSVIRARNFDEALEIANDTEYGLTGSIYSRKRAHIEKARERFHVGNLYVNRKCTGALVGVHPFGGFNMSGTDSKAGGPDYLLLFTQAKCVSEKVR